jgi:hypothetical protein
VVGNCKYTHSVGGVWVFVHGGYPPKRVVVERRSSRIEAPKAHDDWFMGNLTPKPLTNSAHATQQSHMSDHWLDIYILKRPTQVLQIVSQLDCQPITEISMPSRTCNKTCDLNIWSSQGATVQSKFAFLVEVCHSLLCLLSAVVSALLWTWIAKSALLIWYCSMACKPCAHVSEKTTESRWCIHCWMG